MARPRNATDYFARSRFRSRPPIRDSAANPQTEARAWGKLVKKGRVTIEQARRDIGVSPRQVGTVDARWHEYRNRVLEEFNELYPAEDFVLESTTRPAQHHGSMIFSRKPETVAVKMLVSISGLADPEFGFPRDWSFDAGEVVQINPGRAAQWQANGRCIILSSEKAMQAARATNGDKPLDDLESILRASGRCSECTVNLATRVLGITPLCASCYGREVYARSAVGEPR